MAESALWRRCLAEGLGAGLLTLADLSGEALARAHLLPVSAATTLVPGAIVLLLIYMLSDVSGAHFNPAVSLAFAVRRSFPWRLVPAYVLAQLAGACVAAALLRALGALAPGRQRVGPGAALLLEMGTAAVLVLVILATAQRHARIGPQTGLVVGITIALMHALAGPLAAITLNPARALAPALLEGRPFHDWTHWVGPFLGALLAAALTWLLRGPANSGEQAAASGEGAEP